MEGADGVALPPPVRQVNHRLADRDGTDLSGSLRRLRRGAQMIAAGLEYSGVVVGVGAIDHRRQCPGGAGHQVDAGQVLDENPDGLTGESIPIF